MTRKMKVWNVMVGVFLMVSTFGILGIQNYYSKKILETYKNTLD